MRRALWIGGLLLVLALAWRLASPSSRAPYASQAERPEAPDSDSGVELVAPAFLAPEPLTAPDGSVPAAADAAGGTRRTTLAPERAPEPPPLGVVHGRLRVAETGDPIFESMTVRLRTLELELKDELVTRADGTFTSTQAYPRTVLLARVRNEVGRELVDHEAAFDPAVAGEWPVYVPYRAYPTSVRGRVVDARGEPLGAVRVQLVPLDGWLSYAEGHTDARGRFELAGLRAGRCRVHLQGLWTRSDPVELVLRAGPNELGDLVLPEPRPAELVVRFVCPEEGPAASFPEALLFLKPAFSALEVPFYDYTAEELGGGVFELRLARVPAGACDVRVESLDGRTYEPARFALAAPATIEIRVGGTPRAGARLRVRDAASGETIRSFGLWSRRHGTWTASGISVRHGESPNELDLLGADRWVVHADAHRAQRHDGDPRASGVLEVSLERGWSQLFVFEDLEGDSFGNSDAGSRRALLSGVEVHADGELAGRSDDDGQVLLEGEKEPVTIQFHLPGWRVVREGHHGGLRLVGLVRSP